MSLEQTIDQNFKAAFKNREELKVSTLRMLKSAMKNLAIEKRIEKLDDEDVIVVVKKELKKRQDAIESFKSAGRDDLLAREQAEAEVLLAYMPQMLSEVEISKIIDEVLASGLSDFGQVMKETMAKTNGQADGKLVSQLVKQKIQT
ncbi:GatB/YqeY domain-containing protein [Patescibacteria group bacterium]|nr:GatB/YqeY domain-containing protein [Patescibacteria group bacterium]